MRGTGLGVDGVDRASLTGDMSPTADPTTDAPAEATSSDAADGGSEASAPVDTVAPVRRTRARLRAAVVVVGLGVAAGSAAWLTAYAAPEQLVPVERVDATDAPADAGPEAFCRAYGLPRGLDGDASVVSRTSLLRGQAPELASTGTPEDIPGISREGFEVYAALSGAITPAQVEALGDGQGGSLDGREVDGQALRQELGLDADDASELSAFVKYTAATCFSTPGGSAS